MSKNILKPHKFKTNLFDDSRGHLLTLDLETNLFLKHKFKYELFSYTAKKNIFRGMHFQKPPFEQNKLLILIKGKITDYIVNINSNSKFGRIYEYKMNAGDILWIPKGFCHGFKTNSKDVLINYKLNTFKLDTSFNYKLSQRFSKKDYCGIVPEKFGINIDKISRSQQDKNCKTTLDSLKKIKW